ncbi:hypothetical protein VKS41_008854 [Umbelopsis sp. WA50703]
MISLVFCLGASLIIRPRHSADSAARTRTALNAKDFAFFKNRTFLVMAVAVFFQALGYFVPNLFIQSYATYAGANDQMSTIVLSVLNASTIIGYITLGHVSDRYGYSTALILSSLIAGLSAFFLWGFAGKSFALLMTFVIVYGTAGSGFTSSFPSIVTDIAGTEYRKPILINGVFMLLRGIGNVVGNPLGSLLLTSANRVSTGWNHMIYFVGSALIASAVCGAVRYFMRTQTV